MSEKPGAKASPNSPSSEPESLTWSRRSKTTSTSETSGSLAKAKTRPGCSVTKSRSSPSGGCARLVSPRNSRFGKAGSTLRVGKRAVGGVVGVGPDAIPPQPIVSEITAMRMSPDVGIRYMLDYIESLVSTQYGLTQKPDGGKLSCPQRCCRPPTSGYFMALLVSRPAHRPSVATSLHPWPPPELLCPM